MQIYYFFAMRQADAMSFKLFLVIQTFKNGKYLFLVFFANSNS
ncbi:MAG: hypothetical protein RLZ77_554, partial [Bacteroidota bacterium]